MQSIHDQSIVSSVINCPIADVPAPPAVKVIAPSVANVPARAPATPPDVVVVLPNMGNELTIPVETEVAVGVASPSIKVSDREKAYGNLAERTGLAIAKSLATTLNQADKYGTPVGRALKVLSEETKGERMAAAEEKGASLPAKLTVPMIVFFLPALFLVIIGPAILRMTSS